MFDFQFTKLIKINYMPKNPKKRNSQYPADVVIDALQRLKTQHVNIVAQETGITSMTLRNWARQYGQKLKTIKDIVKENLAKI
jgi:transposase-like protein